MRRGPVPLDTLKQTTNHTDTTKRKNKQRTINVDSNGLLPLGPIENPGAGVRQDIDDGAQRIGNTRPQASGKKTKASLTVASLNMRGYGCIDPLHSNNKWNILHQFIKDQ